MRREQTGTKLMRELLGGRFASSPIKQISIILHLHMDGCRWLKQCQIDDKGSNKKLKILLLSPFSN